MYSIGDLFQSNEKLNFMSNNNTKQEQPKPTAPKVDKKELEQSIKSHEKAVKTNQIVKK